MTHIDMCHTIQKTNLVACRDYDTFSNQIQNVQKTNRVACIGFEYGIFLNQYNTK